MWKRNIRDHALAFPRSIILFRWRFLRLFTFSFAMLPKWNITHQATNCRAGQCHCCWTFQSKKYSWKKQWFSAMFLILTFNMFSFSILQLFTWNTREPRRRQQKQKMTERKKEIVAGLLAMPFGTCKYWNFHSNNL